MFPSNFSPFFWIDYSLLFFSSLLFLWILYYFALNLVVTLEVITSILDLSNLILTLSLPREHNDVRDCHTIYPLTVYMLLLCYVLILSILSSSKDSFMQSLLTYQYFVTLYSFLHFQPSFRILYLCLQNTFNISFNAGLLVTNNFS